MDRMRDIVGVIDSSKDKYENLIDRMKSYTEKRLSQKGFAHQFHLASIDKKTIDGSNLA